MIEIRFLGGGGEVGRQATLIDTGVEKFLFEYGINVQTGDKPIQPKTNLDGVFITHAHLDHSGLIPQLYSLGYEGPVYATPATFDLMSILLRDSVKIQKRRGGEPDFNIGDIGVMEKNQEFVEPGQKKDFSLSSAEFFRAGHIPGSISIVLECKDKRILYTGDLKFIDTELMKGSYSDYKDIDIIISESTYSYTNHPDREKLEDRLKQVVQETVYSNGIALVPSFAVGRTQELLIVLHKLGIPLYLDGMGIRATARILKYPNSVRDSKELERAFGIAHKVHRENQRKKVIENPCAIITTAGMLNGGPVASYIRELHDRQDCSLTLTGFQVEGTAGRKLLDTGKYSNGEIDVKPRMKLEFLDFSAHTDHDHLVKFYEKLSPEKVVLVHGDHTQEFAKELKAKGFGAEAPRNGETVKIY